MPSSPIIWSFVSRRAVVDAGVPSGTLDRLIREGVVRAKKIGGRVFVSHADVERVVGWPEEDENSTSIDPEVAEMASRFGL
jgi:hypothetical protein